MKSSEQFTRLFPSMMSQENESILSVISSVSVLSDVFFVTIITIEKKSKLEKTGEEFFQNFWKFVSFFVLSPKFLE